MKTIIVSIDDLAYSQLSEYLFKKDAVSSFMPSSQADDFLRLVMRGIDSDEKKVLIKLKK